jgi:hypothetical protein
MIAYSIGTWDSELQAYTPQAGMRNPSINVPWRGMLAALRELRREHGYDASRGRFPMLPGQIEHERWSDWTVLVERTDGAPEAQILKRWER